MGRNAVSHALIPRALLAEGGAARQDQIEYLELQNLIMILHVLFEIREKQ